MQIDLVSFQENLKLIRTPVESSFRLSRGKTVLIVDSCRDFSPC
jgi:hypothetical protein